MPVLDQTILSQLQRVTLEHDGDGGSSWPTGMWTRDEILTYLNDRQNRLLLALGLVWTVEEPAIVGGVPAQPNPATWMATRFLAYHAPAGTYRELPRMDTLELDLVLPSWPLSSSLNPRGFYEIDGDTTNTYVIPAPLAVGASLEWYFLALGTTLTGAGVAFTVPDDFTPTIKYGVLADMFGKVGPTANPILATAAAERWEEGVELGKVMALDGWLSS